MFSGGFRGQKLKTNLRLCINRLKLMEKKKTELAQKARKEIADYMAVNKYDRARIRVEHIIREDYMVEAMELIELYADMLLARFGLIETMKYCDEALVESVSTIIWAAPRVSTDCPELKMVADQLVFKYGKEFGQQARANTNNTVNERLINKLSPDPPPKILVERYLIEIARNYNVPFTPDADVMMSEGIPSADAKEFEALGGGVGFEPFSQGPGGPPPPHNPGNFNGGGSMGPGGGGGGGGGLPNLPTVPTLPNVPGGQSVTPYPPPNSAPYPPPNNNAAYPPPGPSNNMAYPPPPGTASYPPPHPGNYQSPPPGSSSEYPPGGRGTPAPPYPGPPQNKNGPPPGIDSIPSLPDIPSDSMPSNPSGGAPDDIDFDDLTRRFEELKKKK